MQDSGGRLLISLSTNGRVGTNLTFGTKFDKRCLMEKSPVSSPVRYHGLDALRAIAMALGIVLHAALPYFDTSGFWPSDKGDSNVIWAIFEFIHLWRMPLFFILAGFFAALVVDRRSWRAFWRQRLRRVGLPLLVFLPVIALTMPYIWLYGFKGTFTGYIGSEGYSNPWHLWFLFHLLIFVIFMAIWKLIRQVSSIIVQVQRIRNIWHKSVGAILQGIYFPVPVLLFISLVVLLIPSGAELIGNPLAGFLYFSFGYGLFRRHTLVGIFKRFWAIYLGLGMSGFFVYLWAAPQVTDIYKSGGQDDGLGMLYISLKVGCAIAFSLGFIGLAEDRLGGQSHKWRWLADSSYWVYVVHLPVVTLVTFWMFTISIPNEIKFILAILTTSAFALVTYEFFVRRSLVGVLLNGRRY